MDSTRARVQVTAVPLSGLESKDTYAPVKRMIDLCLAVPALVVCLPLIALFSLLILLDNPGHPIFKQRRIGMNGRVFEIYKLRTMFVGSASENFKTEEGDDRITLLGRLLRATKIDELPQIYNIIKGDMSICGPRPLSVDECEHIIETGIEPNMPGFYPTIKPGLIGLEQVNRSRKLSYAERFALNYQYERNCTWRMDMDIFMRAFAQNQIVCLLAIYASLFEMLLLL